MKPTPDDWPRISASVFYDDPRAAIDFLGRAFGFRARLVVEGDGGQIVHSELEYGEGLIMVSPIDKSPREGDARPLAARSPKSQASYAVGLSIRPN